MRVVVSMARRIVFPLFFSLLSIVLAPAAFPPQSQGLALQLASDFHCRSIVFFSRNFFDH